MKYHEIVDYSKLDPFKRLALEQFSDTLSHPQRLNVRIVSETLGEPAIAIDCLDSDFLLAFNVEGLGTKNKIADSMYADSRGGNASYYESIGIDTIAMSTNDLLAIGADPIAFGDIISSGDSNWFSDEKRLKALLSGFRAAADELQLAIPCGETPTLKGIVEPQTLDLAGASIGLIRPKTNLITSQNIQAGDLILGLESSGVHSNGISLIRKIAEQLSDGYFTKLPSGKILGEELLVPTRLYTRPIIELLLQKTELHYIAPITGHGWKKIMRAKKSFSYEIDFVPPKSELFSFLQEHAGIPDEEAYYTWNMGIGLVLIAPRQSKEAIESVCTRFGIPVHTLGTVRNGEKQVIIKPLNVTYYPD